MASADDKNFDDINVTPMVDLYLVLLLIFIIMTTAGVQGLKVDLPSASSKPATQKMEAPKTQAITIDSSGNIKLNAIPISSLSDLETKLSALNSSIPDMPVVVRGDRSNQYQLIMDVLDVLGRVGVNQIGLATQAAK
ncbi:MAG: biopolymer transporter ExbD [Akkermansiaceae bacterium]|nr:biopolymer transporter ExbD [Akkermansiaceae bacterium]MCP5542285.1 biopolymer transporter ExbD [Akkermansiaceae bacterium]MCP5546178.1 biopolymer transporter ExbD [Akkermansiaceae bacterium]